MPKLNVKTVAAAKSPGMIADGDGLYLNVKASGKKSWIFRSVIQGKRRELGIGSVDLVGLAEARETAAAMRKVARAGGDPDAERKAAALAAKEAAAEAMRYRMTFSEAARTLHGVLLPSWKNRKHAETWIASIELHVNPVFGDKPIEDVTREDVRDALDPIWTEKVETAKRVKQRISAIFEWATAEGHFEGANPIVGLKRALPIVKASPIHLSSMSWRQLPDFMTALKDREGISARCLEFLILTASRSGEARGTRWDEIDFEGGHWIIPAGRMKRGVEHRVPLAPEAINVLYSVRGLDSDVVFPSVQRGPKGGKPMSDMVFKSLYKRMAVSGFVTHGFRSTFRDWCSESAKAPPELAGRALSHAVGNAVTRAYDRSDLIDARRELMERWARYATGRTGDVLELVRA